MGERRPSTTAWRKATASQANGACVELARSGQNLATRDSKHGDNSPVLVFTSHEWRTFMEGVKIGKFDLI
jgi:hypothetical protein